MRTSVCGGMSQFELYFITRRCLFLVQYGCYKFLYITHMHYYLTLYVFIWNEHGAFEVLFRGKIKLTSN